MGHGSWVMGHGSWVIVFSPITNPQLPITRKNAKRELSAEEIIHYQKIVIALTETLRLMQEIDIIIPGFPIE